MTEGPFSLLAPIIRRNQRQKAFPVIRRLLEVSGVEHLLGDGFRTQGDLQ